jgi:hypothetical protein
MKGGDRRARRAAAVVLFGTAAAALALTLYYHLGVPGLVGTFLLGLPSLYLSWPRPPDRSLAQVADELADRLRSQWADEAEARRLNDPYPLPVSWTAADPPLAGNLNTLTTLATTGAGWSAAARKTWATKPGDLAGGGDRKLADVLAMVPTGRLVVLGEPGSGKTMLMVGLVLDLLHPDRRSCGGPVPVLATLASWDPGSQGLHDWLGATLITAYPALAAVPPPGSAGNDRFDALLNAGLILPVLDGLDEIPESARALAITRINEGLKPGEQVVITCRTEQYQAAVSPQNGPGVALQTAAVQLGTLNLGDVASYLRKDAGPGAEGRWDFLDTLSAGSPVHQALATPLMAGLARAVYNPRPDERAGDLRHPAELCKFADQSAVEAHLFDAFIPAAYRPPTPGRWTAEQAEPWLVFLARHLEQTIRSPDLAWWQLQEAAPHTAVGLAVGLAAGLCAGLGFGLAAGLAGDPAAALKSGLTLGIFGLIGGLVGGFVSAKAPAGGMRINDKWLAGGLGAGLGLGLLFAFTSGQRSEGDRQTAFLGGLMGGLLFALWTGPRGVPSDLAKVTSPQEVLDRDRQVALLLMDTAGLGAGLVFGLIGGPGAGLATGLAAGLVAWCTLSKIQTAWPSYVLTRGWLALHHQLPWPLMSFLADAHQRGVLRQAGAVYQFRHIELQRRLAVQPEPTAADPRGCI